MSAEERRNAIVEVTTEDPIQEWGVCRIKEELRMESIHISCHEIQEFRKQQNPDEAKRRWSGASKIVRKTLFSSGSNEEWCMDGHEKLREPMGIDVWGICDKFSRYELGLWAVPNARRSEVPVALFLRVVRERQGVPLQLTGDKGSENGKVSMVQTTLWTMFAPSLSVEMIPPARLVRSIRNITRERNWRPIWEKELKNVLEAWRSGQLDIGYEHGNEFHRELATWLWARLVQTRLDRLRERQAHHQIRLQRKVLLPTGGTPYNFYHAPWRYQGENMLIKIPESQMSEFDEVCEENAAEKFLQFGDDESVLLFEALYTDLRAPKLTLTTTWIVWRGVVDLFESVSR
ncbi:hypothetical protein Clacol_009005 [Clathrus columnatus]|uniref:Integrase core domain-containing protein n=1 Tax=Clathrus columnatus TaxID=1419009 RepID=A0AAV5ANV4_9AGAM|nr:hypothetical protein Clacol_009005 [Clathrus columnatus]